MLKIVALSAIAAVAEILHLDDDYLPQEALSHHTFSIIDFY